MYYSRTPKVPDMMSAKLLLPDKMNMFDICGFTGLSGFCSRITSGAALPKLDVTTTARSATTQNSSLNVYCWKVFALEIQFSPWVGHSRL